MPVPDPRSRQVPPRAAPAGRGSSRCAASTTPASQTVAPVQSPSALPLASAEWAALTRGACASKPFSQGAQGSCAAEEAADRDREVQERGPQGRVRNEQIQRHVHHTALSRKWAAQPPAKEPPDPRVLRAQSSALDLLERGGSRQPRRALAPTPRRRRSKGVDRQTTQLVQRRVGYGAPRHGRSERTPKAREQLRPL